MEENKTSTKVDELIKKADESLMQFIKQGKYKDVLLNMSNLNNYSLRNQILIYLQNPNATHVNGMKAWNFYGRSINKGEESIRIIAPIIKKEEIHEDSAYETDDQEPKYKDVLAGYKVSYVFDISQTNGKEIEVFDSTENMVVENFQIYKNALEKCVKDYSFEYKAIDGKADGYCDYKNKIICIREGMTNEKTITTLIHEIGHALAEQRDRTNFKGLTVNEQRQIKEIEAESIALVISNRLGLHTQDFNCSYITAWSDGDIEKFRNNLDIIRSVSYQILSSIEPEIQMNLKQMQQEKLLTEQEVLDKFYKDMNLGFDSKQVEIERVDKNLVFYKLLGYSYVYDSDNPPQPKQETESQPKTKNKKTKTKQKESEVVAC